MLTSKMNELTTTGGRTVAQHLQNILASRTMEWYRFQMALYEKQHCHWHECWSDNQVVDQCGKTRREVQGPCTLSSLQDACRDTPSFKHKWMNFVISWHNCRNYLPSIKAKGQRLHTVLKAAFGIKPAWRIEFFRIRKGNWIATNCPDKFSWRMDT
jgi:hypothetical protein